MWSPKLALVLLWGAEASFALRTVAPRTNQIAMI